jgi:serine/threonine protein kinase
MKGKVSPPPLKKLEKNAIGPDKSSVGGSRNNKRTTRSKGYHEKLDDLVTLAFQQEILPTLFRPFRNGGLTEEGQWWGLQSACESNSTNGGVVFYGTLPLEHPKVMRCFFGVLRILFPNRSGNSPCFSDRQNGQKKIQMDLLRHLERYLGRATMVGQPLLEMKRSFSVGGATNVLYCWEVFPLLEVSSVLSFWSDGFCGSKTAPAIFSHGRFVEELRDDVKNLSLIPRLFRPGDKRLMKYENWSWLRPEGEGGLILAQERGKEGKPFVVLKIALAQSGFLDPKEECRIYEHLKSQPEAEAHLNLPIECIEGAPGVVCFVFRYHHHSPHHSVKGGVVEGGVVEGGVVEGGVVEGGAKKTADTRKDSSPRKDSCPQKDSRRVDLDLFDHLFCVLERTTPQSVYKKEETAEVLEVQDFTLVAKKELFLLFRKILNAVKVLHASGVAHGDLDATNILFQPSSPSVDQGRGSASPSFSEASFSEASVMLTDFDLASSKVQALGGGGGRDGDGHGRRQRYGKHEYVAPEIYARETSFWERRDPRPADIFSLGCLFFYLTTFSFGFLSVRRRNRYVLKPASASSSSSASTSSSASSPPFVSTGQGSVFHLLRCLKRQKKLENGHYVRQRCRLHHLAFLLIDAMLQWEPEARVTAAQALEICDRLLDVVGKEEDLGLPNCFSLEEEDTFRALAKEFRSTPVV